MSVDLQRVIYSGNTSKQKIEKRLRFVLAKSNVSTISLPVFAYKIFYIARSPDKRTQAAINPACVH